MSTYLDLDAIYATTGSGSGGFTAGGDLSGTATNQTVIGLYGNNIANASPLSGQALIWNSGTSKWTPTALSSGTFAAGGDLSGTDTSQTVIALQNTPVSATTPSNGQYLVLVGGQWAPTNFSLTLAGDVTGAYGSTSVVKLRSSSLATSVGTVSATQDGYVLTWNNTNSEWYPNKLPATVTSVTMSGDVSGASSSSIVDKIKTKALAAALASIGAPENGYVLTWNNSVSEWQAVMPAGGAPSGSAGGDLSGTYPNPTVSKINNTTVSTAGGGLSTGSVLRTTGTATSDWGQLNLASTNAVTGTLPKTNQASQDMVGDVTGSTAASVVAKIQGNAVLAATYSVDQDGYVHTWSNSSSQIKMLPIPVQTATGSAGGDLSGTYPNPTVSKINNTTVSTAGGALTTGTILRVTGTSSVDYGALDLANSSAVTGILPKANQGSQDMAGDVTGSTAVSVVAKVNSATVPAAGSLTTGNVLQVSGTSALSYAAVNLAGGANYVTGSLPKTNQANQDLVGDVSGTTGASVVDKIKTKTLASNLSSIGATQDGYVLTWNNSSSEWRATPTAPTVTFAGDLSGTTSTQTVEKIKGTTVSTAGGALSTGTILRVTGVSSVDYGALDLANASAVTGILPKTNQASQDMVGDVTGTTGSSTVVKLQGFAVSNATPTDGYALIWDSGSANWQPELISNAPSIGERFYFTNTTSSIPTYVRMTNSPLASETDVSAATSGATEVLIQAFATQVNVPGLTIIPAGLWRFNTYRYVSSAANDTRIVIRVYSRTTGGTETEIFNITSSEIDDTSVTKEVIEYTTTSDSLVDQTDRIVIKFFCTTSGGASKDVHLVYDGSTNASNTSTPLIGATSELFGDVSGAVTNNTVNKIKGTELGASVGTVGAVEDGYALVWENGSSTWIPKAVSVNLSAYVLKTTTITSGTGLSGGGDLSANRTLSVNYGTSSTTACVGDDSRLSDSRAPNGSASGDLSGSFPGPTVSKVNAATVPAAGALTTGNVLQVSGTSALSYAAINLAGGANYVTGTLPTANQAAQSLSGDASGTTASVQVDIARGLKSATTTVSVSAATAPSSGQVLTATSSTTATWQTPTGGGFSPPITLTHVTKTGNYTITTSDYVILCNTSGGAFNITLPTVVTGQSYIIKDVGGAFETNNITLVRAGSEKIEGIAASRVLSANWGVYHVMNNGTDWFLI